MGARGEKTIQVKGREVGVLFTNRALVAAEARLKKGIIAVAESFAGGGAGITEVVTLLHVGMEAYRVDSKAGGMPVTLKQAYAVIDAVGFAAVAAPVMEAVAAVLSYAGGEDAAVDPEDEQDPNE